MRFAPSISVTVESIIPMESLQVEGKLKKKKKKYDYSLIPPNWNTSLFCPNLLIFYGSSGSTL